MEAIKRDFRRARLCAADRAMLEFVEKLTLRPAQVEEADLERLRGAGFDDYAIHDVVQAAALFAYYDRLADGLGVDPEPEWE